MRCYGNHQTLTLHDPIALRLALVTVNAESRPSSVAHLVGEVVGLALRLHEDQRLGLRLKSAVGELMLELLLVLPP